jgi:hypothetical protein
LPYFEPESDLRALFRRLFAKPLQLQTWLPERLEDLGTIVVRHILDAPIYATSQWPDGLLVVYATSTTPEIRYDTSDDFGDAYACEILQWLLGDLYVAYYDSFPVYAIVHKWRKIPAWLREKASARDALVVCRRVLKERAMSITPIARTTGPLRVLYGKAGDGNIRRNILSFC